MQYFIKLSLIKQKINLPSSITWKTPSICSTTTIISQQNSKKNISLSPSNNHTFLKEDLLLSVKSYSKDMSMIPRFSKFILTIREINNKDKLIGFIFKFDKIETRKIGTISSNKNLSKCLRVGSQKRIIALEEKNDFFAQKNNSTTLPKIAVCSDLQINKRYIPEKNSSFFLDIKNMSYTLKKKQNNILEYKELIKQAALNKMKKFMDVSSKDNNQNESSNSGNDRYSSSSFDDENESEYLTSSEGFCVPKDENKAKINDLNEYYQVNLKHIIYKIYDYEKRIVIEPKVNPFPQGQVELLMSKNHSEKDEKITENNDDITVNSNKENMKIDKDKTTTFNKKDDPENTERGFYDEEDHTQAIGKQISYIYYKKRIVILL